MITAGAGGKKPSRQPELGLAVIAVVAADVVAGIRPAGHPALQVEEPRQPPIGRIDGIEPTLAAGAVVHVHPEEHLAVGDQRGRLDLVPLAIERAQPGRVQASRSGAELPGLGARARIDRVHRLAGRDEDALRTGGHAHVRRADVRVAHTRVLRHRKPPHLGAVPQADRVEIPVPRLDEDDLRGAFAGRSTIATDGEAVMIAPVWNRHLTRSEAAFAGVICVSAELKNSRCGPPAELGRDCSVAFATRDPVQDENGQSPNERCTSLSPGHMPRTMGETY